MSPEYSYEHEGQTLARRLRQRTGSMRSGSPSVLYTVRRCPAAVSWTTSPRSRTGRAQCPHRASCSAHRSKSGRPARVTISGMVCGPSPVAEPAATGTPDLPTVPGRRLRPIPMRRQKVRLALVCGLVPD